MQTTKREAAELRKLRYEAAKFRAEARKLVAEAGKLAEERDKLHREVIWYPLAIATGLVASVATVAALVVKTFYS